MDKNQRIAELRELETLTVSEVEELMELSAVDRLLELPKITDYGVTDLAAAVRNLGEVAIRAANAERAGFALEALSLRLQHADLWLRIFWVAKNGTHTVYPTNEGKMFGALITECERLGLEPYAVRRLRAFNTKRVEAIHKFLLGAISYAAIQDTCAEYRDLPSLVGHVVSQQLGLPNAWGAA